MKRRYWKMPLAGASAAFVAVLPSMFYGNDLGAFLATVGLSICVGCILLVVAAVKLRRLAIPSLAMLASFCIAGWFLFKSSYEIYATGRWLARSKQYKAEVLAQPQPPNGEFKHVEWDGWGFAGSDTTVYLVFDPENRLPLTSNRASGTLAGLPCPVWRTQRLEPHWDYVVFYTNTGWGWDSCR